MTDPRSGPPTGEKLLAPDCARIAAEVEDAIAAFRALGLPAHKKGPLVLALGRLREIVARGVYGPSDADLRIDAIAVRVAIDFIQIARFLPTAREATVVHEFRRMFDGTLDVRDYHGAHDLRAQFAFGSMLLQHGYPVSVVRTRADQTPDFVCSVAYNDYGVEVKRPANERSMIERVDKAARQLATLGLPGIVVLDLSRLHGAYYGGVSPATGPDSFRAAMQANFIGHTGALVKHCEAQARNPIKRDKYSYVLGLVCFVGIPYWLEHDRSAPASLATNANGPVFWSSMERNLIGIAMVFTRRIAAMFGGTKYASFGITIAPRPVVTPPAPVAPPEPPRAAAD